ncbi:site-2 protease family protein [Candidatus Dependentiae bacterium]|nr:site-2 protease family protein [Candidatus Dependentiae bacterium]
MTSSQNILALIHEVAILFPVFLLLFSFRGFFMAATATLLGDKTPREEEFLTLNPFRHLDIMSLAMFVGIVYFVGGMLGDFIPRSFLFLILIGVGQRWRIEVAVTTGYFKHPRLYEILYGLSGFMSFLVLGFIGLLVVKILNFATLPHCIATSCMEFLRSVIDTALFYGVVNAIPLPPLDAARILYPLTPDKHHHIIDTLYEYDFIIMLAIYIIPGVSHIFWYFVTSMQISIKSIFISLLF